MTNAPGVLLDPLSQLNDRTTSRSVWLCRAPLLIAAMLICVICGSNIGRLVTASAPRDPWEATEVVEAWRSLRGMPVYDLASGGHSTHIYGALVPWLQGEIFRWVGPNNVSGRLLTFFSGLAVVGLLVAALRGEGPGWYFLVAGAVVLGVNNRTNQYFAENRPDMTAMLFAAAGVLLLGLGQERRRWLFVALGTACLVIGFFFKQTAFIFAAVPLVALALRWRRPSRSDVLMAIFPLAVSFGVIVALRIFSPTVYYYMITVHRAVGLDLLRAARCFWDLLIDSPLFLVLLGECLVFDARSLERDPRVRWLFAVFAVTMPFSSVAAGKVGGASNSLLPALLAMTAFCVLRLPRLFDGLQFQRTPLPIRLAQGTFVALLIIMSTFPHMTRSRGLIEPVTTWDHEYGKAVALVGRLPGTVVCPEDPTIPLYAKGYAGQSIFAEFDTHVVDGNWPTAVPEIVLANCRTADYVLDIADYCQDLVQGKLLRDLGFEPAPEMAPELSCYRIWRKKAPGAASSTGRTALSYKAGAGLDQPLDW